VRASGNCTLAMDGLTGTVAPVSTGIPWTVERKESKMTQLRCVEYGRHLKHFQSQQRWSHSRIAPNAVSSFVDFASTIY